MVVVVLDPGRDPGPGGRPGREVLDSPQFEPQVECHDSITALSRRPGRPIDWETDSRSHAARNRPALNAKLGIIGVEDDGGHLPAAHRHRHHQRPVGQLRVMMLAQREPQHPA